MTPEERRAKSREYNRRYRERHPDRYRAQQEAFDERHPGRRAEISKAFREREPMAARQHRSDYLAKPGKIDIVRQAIANWQAAHPERHAMYLRERRERVRARSGGVPAREYASVLRRDPCCYCGASSEQIDHIEPVSRGGSGEWCNLTAACKSCNSGKCRTPLLSYLLAVR